MLTRTGGHSFAHVFTLVLTWNFHVNANRGTQFRACLHIGYHISLMDFYIKLNLNEDRQHIVPKCINLYQIVSKCIKLYQIVPIGRIVANCSKMRFPRQERQQGNFHVSTEHGNSNPKYISQPRLTWTLTWKLCFFIPH